MRVRRVFYVLFYTYATLTAWLWFFQPARPQAGWKSLPLPHTPSPPPSQPPPPTNPSKTAIIQANVRITTGVWISAESVSLRTIKSANKNFYYKSKKEL